MTKERATLSDLERAFTKYRTGMQIILEEVEAETGHTNPHPKW